MFHISRRVYAVCSEKKNLTARKLFWLYIPLVNSRVARGHSDHDL